MLTPPLRAGLRAPRVRFEIGDVEYSLTVAEARGIIARIRTAIDALRVKCPSCRCEILPDEDCGCCADSSADLEPFI